MAKKLLFLIFICFCVATAGKAQPSIAGGEIYYELTGPQKFKVTVHVYRQCESYPLLNLTGYVYGDTFSVPIVYTRIGIKKINDTCGNPCQYVNNFSNPGFEKHTFEAVVDFTDPAYDIFVKKNICKVHFSVRQSGRSIFNTTQMNGFLYFDAATNICDTFIKKNHSPVFSMEPKFIGIGNQAFRYSPGPLDTADYDSLAFSLEPVKVSFTDTIAYIGNLKPSIPFTPYCPPDNRIVNCRALPNAKPPRGFFFDQTSCQIVFTPMRIDEKGYMNIRINEYRKNPATNKMTWIGYTSREMMVDIKSLENSIPPVISEIPASNIVNICAKKERIKIVTTDDFSKDTSFLFWDGGYKAANFTLDKSQRERTATIDFVKDSLHPDLRNQFFTVGSYNKACNQNLSTRTYIYSLLPEVSYELVSSLDSCRTFTYSIQPRNSGSSLYNGILNIYSPDQTVLYSGSTTGQYTFNSNGIHRIVYTITASGAKGKCNITYIDSIYISNALLPPELNITRDTSVCAGHTSMLYFSPASIPALQSYTWLLNNSTLPVTDTMLAMEIKGKSVFNLTVTDQNGCRANKTITYNIIKRNQNILPDFFPIQCAFSPLRLIADTSSAKSPISYQWKINGRDTSVQAGILNFKPAENARVELLVKDDNHCVFRDSVNIPVFERYAFQLVRDRPSICKDSTLTISMDNLNKPVFAQLMWSVNGVNVFNTGKTYSRSYNKNSKVSLMFKDPNYCTVSDSVDITTIDNPGNISISGNSSVCEGSSFLFTAKTNRYLPGVSYQWFIDKAMVAQDSSYHFKSGRSGKIVLKADHQGCTAETSAVFITLPEPELNITGKQQYAPNEQINLSTDKSFTDYLWFNGVSTRDNSFNASTLGTPGTYTVWCQVTEITGCSTRDSMNIFTNGQVSVQSLSLPKFRAYPNPAETYMIIESLIETQARIMSADGRIILQLQLLPGKNTVNMQEWASGIYLLDIEGQRIMLCKA
jgi:hypothetical protein